MDARGETPGVSGQDGTLGGKPAGKPCGERSGAGGEHSGAGGATPRIRRVYESALYVEDLERAAAFYRDVLGLRVVSEGPRLVSLAAGGGTHLLLFRRGASVNGIPTDDGAIPPHDGAGPVHLAFAIEPAELPEWERKLAAAGVAVESRVKWGTGGTSLYFRDPDGHSVELAPPGIWGDRPEK